MIFSPEPTPPINPNPELFRVLMDREVGLDTVIAPGDPGAVYCRCGLGRSRTVGGALVCGDCDTPGPLLTGPNLVP